jgi:AhpD family alkylhydroperoxidase
VTAQASFLTLNEDQTMQSRMKNPAMSLPGAFDALQALHKATEKGGVPRATLELMKLRASQINGCSVCVDMHSRALKKLGEKDARIFAVAAWREAPYYSDAERELSALVMSIGLINLWNRLNAATRQVTGDFVEQYV